MSWLLNGLGIEGRKFHCYADVVIVSVDSKCRSFSLLLFFSLYTQLVSSHSSSCYCCLILYFSPLKSLDYLVSLISSLSHCSRDYDLLRLRCFHRTSVVGYILKLIKIATSQLSLFHRYSHSCHFLINELFSQADSSPAIPSAIEAYYYIEVTIAEEINCYCYCYLSHFLHLTDCI